MRLTDLVSLDALLARTRVVALPLAARFRGVEVREAALIEGTQLVAEHPVWAEFSPFLEYEVPEAANWLAAALEYGFSSALTRFESGSVPVNATVPAVPAELVGAVLARYDGCEAVKIKVAERGQTLADDLARVAAVRAALPDARLRLDANGGWSVAEAEAALRALTATGARFEYVEQPVASIAELAALRRALDDLPGPRIRLAADELVRKASDPLEVARAGVADHLIVKAQPLGGITAAARIVAASGLTATVSSALDTSVGIVMGAQLAARLPGPPFAAGLGTAALFTDDVAEPRVPERGRVSLTPVVPQPDALARLAVSAERRAWWHERIAACYRHLAGYSPE